jgi:hypothetical protein
MEHEHKHSMKINCFALAAALTMAGGITCVGQTKTWTGGGDGLAWTNASNWSGGSLPGEADTVAITSGAGTRVVIWADNDISVQSIQCTKSFVVSGGSLTLSAGSSQFSGAFTLTNGATLSIDGSGAKVTASSTTVLAGAWLYASGGAAIHLPNLYSVSSDNYSPIWQADGSGSTIDLSSVTNLTTVSPQILTINGSDGGTVDLHRVTNSVGAVWVDAQDVGTAVNLSGLTGRWKCTSPSGISLTAQTGASINIPNVTQLENAALEVDDTGVIPTAQLNLLTNCTLTVGGAAPNFGRVTNINDTWVSASSGGVARLTSVFRVTNGHYSPIWQADGSGSTIDLSSVTNLTTVSPQILTINGSNGGSVDLHRVTNSVGAVWVDVQDDGTVVNLSGLTGRWKCTSPAGISLTAQTGASINIPNVTQLENAALEVDDTGVIPTAQLNLLTNCTLTVDGAAPNFSGLTNIDDTSVHAKEGGVARLTGVMWVAAGNQSPFWHAEGGGSLIDLSGVLGVSVENAKILSVETSSGGKVDLHGLIALSTGEVQLTADEAGSVIDLSGLSGFISTGPGSSSLTAQNSGTILLGANAFLLCNVDINIPSGNPVLPPTVVASGGLTLYGKPWHSYWIEKRDTSSELNPWVFAARVGLTNSLQPFAPAPAPNTEYQVWEFVADPPILDLFPAANHHSLLIIYDTPGKTNQILRASSVTAGTTWDPGTVTIMTNAFRNLGTTSNSYPVRFFRAQRL